MPFIGTSSVKSVYFWIAMQAYIMVNWVSKSLDNITRMYLPSLISVSCSLWEILLEFRTYWSVMITLLEIKKPKELETRKKCFLTDLYVTLPPIPTLALLANTYEENATDDKYFFCLNKCINDFLLKLICHGKKRKILPSSQMVWETQTPKHLWHVSQLNSAI